MTAYNWTEREIEKTIDCYEPVTPHHFHYSYGCDKLRLLPTKEKGIYKMIFLYFARVVYLLFIKIFPKQQNLFACFIEKPNLEQEHFEWLKYQEGKFVFNKEWGENYYKNPIGKWG